MAHRFVLSLNLKTTAVNQTGDAVYITQLIHLIECNGEVLGPGKKGHSPALTLTLISLLQQAAPSVLARRFCPSFR